MAMNLKLPELPKLPKIKKGRMPHKNFINIQPKKKQTFDLRRNIPLLVVIAVVFIVLMKFMVFDRLAVVVTGTGELEKMRTETEAINQKISSMKQIDDIYAHYTTSGMTEEELGRVDRVKAMKLIDKAFLRGNSSNSWNLTGNIMTLKVTGSSLRELNQVAAEIETNSIVERCVISSADKRTTENGTVAVTFTIYLKQPGEE